MTEELAANVLRQVTITAPQTESTDVAGEACLGHGPKLLVDLVHTVPNWLTIGVQVLCRVA